MASNILANYAMPTMESIGQLTVIMDQSFIKACSDPITQEIAEAIATSGGMDGMKYRQWAIKCVGEGMLSKLGTRLDGRSAISKQAKLAVLLTLVGAQMGCTDNKNTYMKTMAATMEERANQTDALAIAYNIIKDDFRTYVNEKSASVKAFPSLKYPSSLPDFTLLGVMIIVNKTMSYEAFCNSLVRPYMEWPEILRKKFIGNFALSADFQKEHMVWEKHYWDNIITSTNNANNKDFKKGFVAKNYATTIKDKFLVLTPDGRLMLPDETGYTKAQFCVCLAYLYQRIETAKGVGYRVAAGDQFSTDSDITEAPKTGNARLLRMNANEIRTVITDPINGRLTALTAAAVPAGFAGTPEVTDLVTTADSNTYSFGI